MTEISFSFFAPDHWKELSDNDSPTVSENLIPAGEALRQWAESGLTASDSISADGRSIGDDEANIYQWLLQPTAEIPNRYIPDWISAQLAHRDEFSPSELNSMMRYLTLACRAFNLIVLKNEEDKLQLPLIPVPLPAALSPIRPGFEDKHHRFCLLKDNLHNFLKASDITVLPFQEIMGLMLVSAVVDSAQISEAALSALLQATQKRVLSVSETAPTELLIRDSKQHFSRYSVIYLNPITELLLCHCVRRQMDIDKASGANESVEAGGVDGVDVWHTIKGVLLLVQAPNQDESLMQWLDDIADVWHLALPAALVRFQRLEHEAHSLRLTDLFRSGHSKPTIKSSLANPTNLTRQESDRLAQWVRPTGSVDKKSLKTITAQELQAKLDKIQGGVLEGTVSWWVLAWGVAVLVEIRDGRDDLRARKLGHNKRNLKRLASHIDYIARVMAPYIDILLDPVVPEDLPGLYAQIMSKPATTSNRIRTARLLHQFHRFMIINTAAVSLTKDGAEDPLAARNHPRPVDVNWLHISEFELVKKELSTPTPTRLALLEKHPALPNVVLMVAILAYRLGLRGGESLFIEQRSIVGEYPNQLLLIRPTPGHPLKTRHSHRRYELSVFLTVDEHHLLEHIRNNAAGRYLFGVSKRTKPKVSQQLPYRLIRETIHRVMREVTGDGRLRFHHLRHSAASNLSLALDYADHPDIAKCLHHMPATVQWLEAHAQQLKMAALGHTSGPSRSALFAVAATVGHSGPAVTLKHYIHPLPYMLAHRTQTFDVNVLAPLVGKTKQAIQNHLRIGGPVRVGYMVRKWVLEPKHAEMHQIEKAFRGTRQQTDQYAKKRKRSKTTPTSLQAVLATLRLIHLDGTAHAVVEQETGVDQERVSRWVTNSELLAGIKAMGSKHMAVPMMVHPESDERIPIPVVQGYEFDRKYAEYVAEKLLNPANPPGSLSSLNPFTVKSLLSALGNPRFSLIFRDVEAACAVIELLDSSAIARSHLKIRLVHGRIESGWMKRANEYWKSGLPSTLRFQPPYQLSSTERIYVTHGALSINLVPPKRRNQESEFEERSPGAILALSVFLIDRMTT